MEQPIIVDHDLIVTGCISARTYNVLYQSCFLLTLYLLRSRMPRTSSGFSIQMYPQHPSAYRVQNALHIYGFTYFPFDSVKCHWNVLLSLAIIGSLLLIIN